MARQKKTAENRLEHQITGLFTAQEKAEIDRAAQDLGISLSAMLRIYVRRGMAAPDPFTPTKQPE